MTAATASVAGMWYTNNASTTATARPASAANWARTCQKASNPSRVTTGSVATSADSVRLPRGL